MRLRERLPCAVGNVFNDTYRQLQFSFAILFLMKVIKLSASHTGLILLIIQISDALISPLTGYLGDRVDLPFVAKKIGGRKSWHLLATILMAISVPLLYNRCFLCDISNLSWLPLVYYGIFGVQLAVSFNIVEINHLAYITTVAESVEECTALNALRTMFSFLSGVYVYVIAWTLLGRDSADSLGPNNLSDFVYLSWIVTGTGVFFALVFHIGTKKPPKRRRKSSSYIDFTDAGGVFSWAGTQDKDSRKTSIAHGFVDMLMGPLYGQNNGDEEPEREDTAKRENDHRRKSLLQTFLAAIFYEKEDCPETMPDTETEEATGLSGDGDSKAHAVSELRHLDRDRKISILTTVIEEVVSRSKIKQLEMSTNDTGNNVSNEEGENGKTKEWRRGSNTQEHKSMVFLSSEEQQSYSSSEEQQSYSANNGDRPGVTQEVLNDKEEAFETQKGRECGANKDEDKQMALENNKELQHYFANDEGYTENIQELSVSSRQRKRKNGDVSVPDHRELGLRNFGFDSDGRKDITNEDVRKSASDLRKKSVTFSAPESPVLLSEIYEERETGLNEDKSTEEPETRTTETRSEYPEQWFKSVEDGDNSSAPDDHPKVLCRINEKKGSKTMKAWTKDPNLYRVAIIYTCSRLAQDTVYSYLPLFLIERLHFRKEATAYFPLVLLTSATVSSTICEKLNRKIGSKTSYLLAAFLVMGGAVWSYFQTITIRQSTYAPVVLMGSGLSIMYVMALTFITELIGEHKETSGSVISIITIIARMSSGGLVMFIQKLYPEEGNEAISSYVHHVFAVAPGMLTLMGSLMVLFFQPSKFICRTKGPQNDIEAQEEESSADICAYQFSSESTTKSSVNMDETQSVDRSTPRLGTEDTKL